MINPEENKRFNEISAVKYLSTRNFKVSRFLQRRVRKDDWNFVLNELMMRPIPFAYIIKYNYEMRENQRVVYVLELIIKEGRITIMLGAKGYGKTATAVWAIEQIRKFFPHKNIYWFGYHEEIAKLYPFVKQTLSLTDLEKNSVLLFDEGSLFLFARDAMKKKQKERIQKLPTMRHRGLAIVIISQFSTSLDTNLFLLSDYIWFKPYFVSDFDKKLNLPPWLKHMLPSGPGENLVYDLNREIFYDFKNTLPLHWSDKLSKGYGRIETQEKALKLLDKLMYDMNFSEEDAMMVLELRGWDAEKLY